MLSWEERPAAQVRINGTGPCPLIEVDGHGLRTVVRAVLVLEADEVPMLKVTLLPLESLDASIPAKVVLDEATAEALKSMGWTPPLPPGESLDKCER